MKRFTFLLLFFFSISANQRESFLTKIELLAKQRSHKPSLLDVGLEKTGKETTAVQFDCDVDLNQLNKKSDIPDSLVKFCLFLDAANNLLGVEEQRPLSGTTIKTVLKNSVPFERVLSIYTQVTGVTNIVDCSKP